MFSQYVTRTYHSARGFTLIELIAAVTILLILSGMAIPMARITIKREKERELRHALSEMRDAIDRYNLAGLCDPSRRNMYPFLPACPAKLAAAFAGCAHFLPTQKR